MTETPDLRRDQAKAVRERILAATQRVIEAGVEPTMRAVAREAGISERTLYRYFPAREDLYGAMGPVLRGRASAPMATDVGGLADYVSRLYSTFDSNAGLARALATAAWAPTNVTRPENLRALRSIVDQAFPGVPAAARESAAASLRVLYSAAGWAYLADCGFDLEGSIRHVQWVTQAVLERLERLSGGAHA